MNTTISSMASRVRSPLILLTLAPLLGAASAQPVDEAALLASGPSLERALAAGGTHVYQVETTPARLVAEQHGVDVELEVTPAGGETFVADGPFDRRGWEAVLLAGAPSFRVVVRGREAGAPPGRYVLRLEALTDADRLAAARADSAATRLYSADTPEAWREAAVQYGRAHEQWRALGANADAARCLYARAVLHRLVDEARTGMEAAEEARELFRDHGDSLSEAHALNELGLGQWRLGEHEAARRSFELGAELARSHDAAYLIAATASNFCLIHLSRGELAAGRECYVRSLPAIEAARVAQITSAARTNLGRLAEHLGEPEEALTHYGRALEILVAAGDRRGQARTLNNLGVLLRGLGELEAAMARYAEALDIFAEIEDRRWQARVLLNIGYAYRSLDSPERAQTRFERALALFRQSQDRRGEATALDNLALVHRDLGRGPEALELHRRALELRRQDGGRRDEALTLRRLAELQAELGDREAALTRLGEAVILAAELGDRPGEAEARQGLGRIHLRRGELEAARRELEAAFELATGASRRTIVAQLRIDLARVEHAAGQADEARRHLQAALGELEAVRAGIAGPDLRATASGLVHRADLLDVELRMAAHRADPGAGHDLRALEAAERARARTLLELLLEADVDLARDADLARDVDPALYERRRGLALRLEAKAERLADPKLDTESRAALGAEQLTLLHRLETVDAEIRRHNPVYGEIVRPQPLTAAEIQALTDPDTALAIYLLGEPRSYLWRVTPTAVDTFELPARPVIENAARRLYGHWSEPDPARRAAAHAAAAELAELLRLAELRGPRHLAIVPDGALHVVPFAGLPVEPGSDAVPEPLVARSQIVVLPAAAVLALGRRLHASAPHELKRGVAVLADPVFGPDYARLPGSRLEAAAIAAATAPAPSLMALGSEVSRELVESGRLSLYDVVHFATHGVIDTVNPALSGLVISRAGPAEDSHSEILRLHDIYGLRLDAELVVLSGCRTALGPVVRGEGPIGLARGFMYAGARRVLASLWQVEDRAGAALMTHFYRALAEQALPPAAALAAAQRELSQTRRFRDPYYWAGFVLVGDWR